MRPGRRRHIAAFTLVEVLVASVILVTIIGFLLVVTDQTARVWSSTSAKVEQFREARTAFERVTTRLSQATLNTYWDYNSPTLPTRYERRSELRFISGGATALLGTTVTPARISHAIFFNAPLGVTGDENNSGLANVLNTLGYFVEFGDDTAQRPTFITTAMIAARWRFRLMEFSQPTENFSVYQFTNANAGNPTKAWFTTDMNGTTVLKRVIAENVIALIVTPRLPKAEEPDVVKDLFPAQKGNPDFSPLAKDYLYDSTGTNADNRINPKNQLPPIVQLTMIAIDDKSAEKLGLGSTKSDVFGVAALFKNTQSFKADLATLEGTLGTKRLRYRIFTTNVHIRAAKWSREQKN